jgi:hypothetical protein
MVTSSHPSLPSLLSSTGTIPSLSAMPRTSKYSHFIISASCQKTRRRQITRHRPPFSFQPIQIRALPPSEFISATTKLCYSRAMQKPACLVLVLCLCLASWLCGQPAVTVTAVRAARMIDVHSGTVVANAVVLVEKDRIQARAAAWRFPLAHG